MRRGRASSAGRSSAPALALIGVFFVVPVVAGLVAQPHRLRSLCARRPVDTCASSASTTTRACCRRRCSGRRSATRFYFVVVGGPLSIGLSLGAALLLNARLARWQAFFRTALFAPVVTTLVAVAVVWRYLCTPAYGLINQALASIGIDPIDWLGDPRWAMPAIILFAVWKNFGYNMMIFLAGAAGDPERALRGRAHRRRRPVAAVRHVTLPMLGADAPVRRRS